MSEVTQILEAIDHGNARAADNNETNVAGIGLFKRKVQYQQGFSGKNLANTLPIRSSSAAATAPADRLATRSRFFAGIGVAAVGGMGTIEIKLHIGLGQGTTLGRRDIGTADQQHQHC